MSSRQLEQVLLAYYQLWHSSPFPVPLLQSRGKLRSFLGSDCSQELHNQPKSGGCRILSNIQFICWESLVQLQEFPRPVPNFYPVSQKLDPSLAGVLSCCFVGHPFAEGRLQSRNGIACIQLVCELFLYYLEVRN